MVYLGIVEPKKKDKYVKLEIIDNSLRIVVYLTERESDLLETLKEQVEKAKEKIGDKLVKW